MLTVLTVALVLVCVALMILSAGPPPPWGQWLVFGLALVALLLLVIASIRGGHVF